MKFLNEITSVLADWLREREVTEQQFDAWASRLEMTPAALAGVVIGSHEPTVSQLYAIGVDTGIPLEALCKHLEACKAFGSTKLVEGSLIARGDLHLDVVLSRRAANLYLPGDFTSEKIRARSMYQALGNVWTDTGLYFPDRKHLVFEVIFGAGFRLPFRFMKNALQIRAFKPPRHGQRFATVLVSERRPLTIAVYNHKGDPKWQL